MKTIRVIEWVWKRKNKKKINSEWKLFVKLQFRPYTEESLTSKAYKGCRLEICSKNYWFIRWLVENDKIRDYYEWNDDIDYVREKYWFYEALLMLLSISDTPIEFLISVLKNV